MSRPPRLPAYCYVGVQRYFLTICTLNRANHFEEKEIVDLAVDQFLRVGREEDVAIVVYLAMPDHLHLLVDGVSERANLEEFVKLSKQRSGFEFKRRRRCRLWQEGYYDRVLRGEEDTWDVVQYTLENPLRKKLAETASDYSFWGSALYEREQLLQYIGGGRRL